MLDFLSPDGQIGSPLQALGFAVVILIGAGVVLHGLDARRRAHGLAQAGRSLLRFDTMIVLTLGALAILNLVHHAIMPLGGVFRPEVGDGGLIENITITMMAIPVLWFLHGLVTGKTTSQLGPIGMSLVSILLLVGIGEEVSWGQHWFGYDVPEAIASTNLQAELNLHNYVAPGMMEALYFGAGCVLLALAANLNALMQDFDQADGMLALKALLVLSAILMSHHVFQELAELAVILSAVLIWKRLDDGRLAFRPGWMQAVARA
jgi:hypothetical protein